MATAPSPTSIEPSENPYKGEARIVVGYPEQQTLRLRFSANAYRMLEKMTGVPHFKRIGGNVQDMINSTMSIDFLVCSVIAATRKTEPSVTSDWLMDALDEMPPSSLAKLWTEVVQAFVASMQGPEEPKENPTNGASTPKT